MRRALSQTPETDTTWDGTVGEVSATSDSGSRSRSLRRILPHARFVAADDIRFEALAEPGREVRSGELVCYRIGHADPARVVADALARGAAGILTEQLLPCSLPQCIVGDADAACSEIWSTLLDRPDRKVLSVAVIGSAGKSTTALLIATLFRSLGVRTAYQTDLGECDGVVQNASDRPLPSGESLIRWLGEAADCECQVAVFEVSDEALRRGQCDAVQFDLLVVAGSIDSRRDFGPSALGCALERIAGDGVVVAPADDAQAVRIVRDSGVQHVTYGIRRPADVTLKLIDQSSGMTTAFVCHGDTTAVMETPLCGAAMAANHAAAATVGVLIDQPLTQIVEALGSLRAVPGRFERLTDTGFATVLLDAAGTPARLRNSLRAARSMRSGGRLWCVLALRGDEKPEELASYGSDLERFGDHVVLTCHRDAKPLFLKLAHQVLDGVNDCASLRLVADHERAVRWAVGEAAERDLVLVAGGMEGDSPKSRRAATQRVTTWIETERQAVQAQPQPSTPKFRVIG